MHQRPPKSPPHDTLLPHPALFRSQVDRGIRAVTIPLDTVQYDEPWMFTNILSARFGDITVKYIAGYSGGKAHQFTSQLSIPLPVIVGSNESSVRRTTHELEVLGSAFDERLDWVGGLYYSRNSSHSKNAYNSKSVV